MTPLSCFRAIAVTAAPLSYRLFQLTTSRFYGSVAAAEPLFDPDNYYSYYQAESDSDQHRDSLRSVTLPDTEGRERRRGVQWAFIGSPRAKKHVYAEMPSKLLEVPRISMSSLVRQDLSLRSSLHKQIANAVNRGEVVSEDIIFGLLSKRLEDGYYRDNFIVTNRGGSLKEKLEAYAELSKPLEDYYQKQKKLLEFQVGSAPVETWQGLLTALHLQHINAAYSSQELMKRSHLL
ncbi:probable adenylate kinase 7, mitochondrial isoform X2 [Citrus sinensis]|uniref:probable adenylate kinase 7, mitochondrial isoform X2 n=1 Tax=Citrus sinensis TaxID=2711 RepID=UPI000CED59B8|nr:probable adenylate kinase 7, mitochondrial isoform X2 [Citrus sinensis]XP_024045149.1 probable adenylate kinase 7, mitochondrial isoform X2 [Citrus x clementina]